MKACFSEFSYGYAVTEEIVGAHGPLTIALIFPSLLTEGRLGYNLRLDLPGCSLFLQFKLSDCRVGGNAREAKSGLLTNPFHRMHLRANGRSRQHQLLVDLESHGNRVYYVAPAFYRETEFYSAYR